MCNENGELLLGGRTPTTCLLVYGAVLFLLVVAITIGIFCFPTFLTIFF
jgi:hypothetical protein